MSMTSVNASQVHSIGQADLHGLGAPSLQLLFAHLQLKESQGSKEKAEGKMDILKDNQARAREMSDMKADILKWQSEAKARKYSQMPPEARQYFKDRGLDLPERKEKGVLTKYNYFVMIASIPVGIVTGGIGLMPALIAGSGADSSKDMLADTGGFFKQMFLDENGKFTFQQITDFGQKSAYDIHGNLREGWQDVEEWEFCVKALDAAREQTAVQSEQLMTFVQDFMGQYNSYLSGANNTMRQANQLMAGLARGPAE